MIRHNILMIHGFYQFTAFSEIILYFCVFNTASGNTFLFGDDFI